MIEIGWAALIVLLLVVASASVIVPDIELIEMGRRLMTAGVVLGVPLQIVYFLSLWAVLTARGQRPRAWYWRPFAHHEILGRRQKLLVLPFYFTGASALFLALVGVLLAAAGMIGFLLAS